MATVVLAESSRDAVLAAVSLARRLPGGADLTFARRDALDRFFTQPAHATRARPYRLIVLGPDLPPGQGESLAARFRKDPADSVHWLDANQWAPADAARMPDLCRGGSWINRLQTHHPFPAVEAAREALALLSDPFSDTLLRLAEERLPRAEEDAWGQAWRDALDVLEYAPGELPESVKPLVHGMAAEIGVVDRAEGEAMRGEIEGILSTSRLVESMSGGRRVTLLVLPGPGKIPVTPLAQAAMARTGAELALVLFDRGEVSLLEGRRRGAEPPVDVGPALEKLLAIPFARRDRHLPGRASILLVDPPSDRLERLVAGLL